MGDRKSKISPISNVRQHLKISMNAAEDLKDEAYVQVLKQINCHYDQ